MNAHFSKWGNSLALRIPSGLAKELEIFDGTAADIQVRDGCLVVTPLDRPVYSLEELLEGMTEANLYGEISTDGPIGNEIW